MKSAFSESTGYKTKKLYIRSSYYYYCHKKKASSFLLQIEPFVPDFDARAVFRQVPVDAFALADEFAFEIENLARVTIDTYTTGKSS